MSVEELQSGLEHGHEYQWTCRGRDYSLLPERGKGGVVLVVKGEFSKRYPDAASIVADGYDLVSMTSDNPSFDEF